MKPAVINNGKNSENSNPNVPQTASNNVQSDTNNNTNRINNDARGFPSPFSARGFGFDDSDDDMFSDMGLRSRMNRMGHPFDWGARKRRGSTGHTEPQPNAYDQYFPDEPDFPGFGTPHWDTFNRKRNQQPTADDRSGFFDYIPPEFRQYMPEHFGFPNMRQHPQMTARSPPSAYQKPPHPQQYVNPEQQHYPQAFQQQPAAPTSPRAKLCDAAIQTEDVVDNAPQTQSNNLKQHGLRNTVDLGQKSQQEEVRSDRAHSAPPREDLLAQQKLAQAQAQANVASNIAEDSSGTGGFSNTGTSMTPQCNVQQPQFNAAAYQQQKQQEEQRKNQQNQQQQSSRQPPPPPQRHQPQQQYSGPTGGARTVPIFVEGRDVPLVNKINIPQQVPQTQQQQRQQQQQQGPKQQNRPAPFVAKENPPQEPNEQSQIPPQTPHTTDCINKIQDIQRDVLDLMGKVERFGGLKGDKEYMYLDEMLTRNLLKLDTIDTNGKESIRLARKEAIKCIQASIGVLDAKSEINAKPKEGEDAAKPEPTTENDEVKESSNVSEQEVGAQDSSDLKETDEAKNEQTAEATSAPKHVSEIKINLGDGGASNEANAKPATNDNSSEENKAVAENTTETGAVGQDIPETPKDKEEVRT